MVNKYTLLLFLTCICTITYGQIDTIIVNNQPLLYHNINQDNDQLIIFLHGSTSQFKDKEQLQITEKEVLLESNEYFIPTFQKAGFDILMPIAHNEYNWLEEGGLAYIKQLVELYQEDYEHIFISGFSDGGTGAYKAFYSYPELFDGVLIFNGYPQHNNFYKKVNYQLVTEQHIIFVATNNDQVIPYEFPLVEYRKQQMINRNCHFILEDGNHTFKVYSADFFNDIITHITTTDQLIDPSLKHTAVYPPLDAYIDHSGTHEIIELYPFRKKIGKQYGMNSIAYQRTDYSYKQYKKLLDKGVSIKIYPTEIQTTKLMDLDTIPFQISIDNKTEQIELINWLKIKSWE